MDAFSYSVLMSVYRKDRPEWLKAALISMLTQTLKAKEIVLIEDGPLPSELEDVIDTAARDNPGLFHIQKLEKNGGLGNALAVGLPLCACEWVARMDSDDISLPDRCEKQARYLLAHPDVDILGGMIEEFDDTPEHVVTKRTPPLTHLEIVRFAKSRNPFNHMTVMLRRDAALAVGGYRTYLRLEDYDLWLRMFRAGAKGANLGDTLVSARCGRDMHARRQGAANTKALIRFYGDMRKAGDIGFGRYVFNVVCGSALYMMPPWMHAVAYKLLRGRA